MKKIVMQDIRKTNYHYEEAIKTLRRISSLLVKISRQL